jgi:integrase
MGERAGWTDVDALVFLSPAGFPIRHLNFMRRVWSPACEAAGLSLTPHDLRASHATWLYDAGWSPVEIAARLGHSKATVTTKHYARRVVGRDVEIADGLDRVYRRSSAQLGHVEGTSDGVDR